MKISQYPRIPNDVINDNDIFLISRPASGGLFSSLGASVGSIMKRIGLNENGVYSKDKLPSDIVYTGNFDTLLTTREQLLLRTILVPIWNSTIGSSVVWPETEFSRKNQPLRANGYYPDVNATHPFYCAGVWLNINEAIKVLTEDYVPYMGGVQCSAKVNKPMMVKNSDSSLTLDYASVNNSNPNIISLGNNAWGDSIRPTSLKRAFDNCFNLRAVVGEIDMRLITSAWNANWLFRTCPNLWQFHLANIPDVITELDLSGVSDDCVTPFRYSASQSEIDSIGYLAKNFDRDIKRTKELSVIVTGNVFDSISRNPAFYRVGDGITYITK